MQREIVVLYRLAPFQNTERNLPAKFSYPRRRSSREHDESDNGQSQQGDG
jgi:hypothetical protein